MYQLTWYEISNDTQKFFIMMISSAQKPIYYHGYHLVDLNLVVFSKVNKLNNFVEKIRMESLHQLKLQ